jgi:hypothetical protein
MSLADKLSNLYCKAVRRTSYEIASKKYGVNLHLKEEQKDLKYKLQLLEYAIKEGDSFDCDTKNII